MTKKLDRMLKPRKKAKKKRTRKRLPKDACVHRGVKFSVGIKQAIDLMVDAIRMQGHSVPSVNLYSEDPAAMFAINMYEEIGSWSDAALGEYIVGVTGKPPTHFDTASMLGTVKCIFHAIFDDGASKEEVSHYCSVWKMWPKVRSKPKRRKSKMATKKAARKKASKKKTTTKRAVRKKAAAKKAPARRAAKKKTAKKKAAANGSASSRQNSISAHAPKLEKLLKRKTGVNVAEATEALGISKKSVRKLFGELGAERMEEVGRYSL